MPDEIQRAGRLARLKSWARRFSGARPTAPAAPTEPSAPDERLEAFQSRREELETRTQSIEREIERARATGDHDALTRLHREKRETASTLEILSDEEQQVKRLVVTEEAERLFAELYRDREAVRQDLVAQAESLEHVLGVLGLAWQEYAAAWEQWNEWETRRRKHELAFGVAPDPLPLEATMGVTTNFLRDVAKATQILTGLCEYRQAAIDRASPAARAAAAARTAELLARDLMNLRRRRRDAADATSPEGERTASGQVARFSNPDPARRATGGAHRPAPVNGVQERASDRRR